MITIAACLLLVALRGEGLPGDLFSFVLASAGDVDRDGVPDVLVSDPVDADRALGAGRVWIVSGKDSTVLRTWRGEDGEGIGTTLGSTGDVDGDGVPDVFVGASNRRGAPGPDRWIDSEKAVWKVVSGRTGAVVHRLEGVALDSRPIDGPSFASLRDADGDSVPDFAIGSARGMRDRTFQGLTVRRSSGSRISLHSGKTAREVWRIESASEDEVVGGDIAAAGDVDGDGIVDLIATVVNSGDPAECARILSGKDGKRIRSLGIAGDHGYEGPRLGVGADLDGDGVEDALVAISSRMRRAVCYSGRDGRTLGEWHVERDAMYASSPSFVPDVDADGRPDVLLTVPGSFSDRSSFLVFSGAKSDGPLLDVGFAPWESSHFACSVQSVPDRDGDGVADLLVGEATQRHHGWQGEARYYSTKTGRVLGSITRASLESASKK